MDRSKINQWVELRYGYYLAGRTLLFNNQMQTAVLMLGYAIETHMKNLLSLHTVNKKISRRHKFQEIYEECLCHGYFTDVKVSEDFLLFVEDNFDRRYPSQTDGTVQRANSRGHAISMAPEVIVTYDDFILQLDMSLTKTLGTPEASILFRGASEVDCAGGEYFFHCNYSAIDNLDFARELCMESLELLREREPQIYDINLVAYKEREQYLKEPDKLINASGLCLVGEPMGGVPGSPQAAENFVYPGKIIKYENGSEIHFSSF